MSKLAILLVVAVVAAVVTGVLEVSVHPEKVASAPGALVQMAKSGNLLERGRVLVVSGKRWFELYSAQENDQKMEVMLGFIREDAGRLDSMLNSSPNPQKVVPQARLLAKSVEQAREQSEKLSEGTLADMRALSEEALGQANASLEKLAQFQKDLAEGNQQLSDVMSDIGVSVPEESQGSEEGNIAGTSDEEDGPEESEAPQNTVPLRF